MASPTQWTWVWVDSSSWWWTGRPSVLWFMGSQRVGHNWMTELNWTSHTGILSLWNNYLSDCHCILSPIIVPRLDVLWTELKWKSPPTLLPHPAYPIPLSGSSTKIVEDQWYLHISQFQFLNGPIGFKSDNNAITSSSVHGILQTRILEWVSISFSRGSSQSRNQTWVASIAVRFFTNWVMREVTPAIYQNKNKQSYVKQ